ncbi:MAG: IS110 family RNA-guided transposase [Planctomycetota bacterium]|jgi:transposase
MWLGIDWSEKHLDLCVKNDADVIYRERVDNSDSGFNRMVEKFSKENIDLNSIKVAIESPHQRVVDFLLVRGVAVYPVNPKAVFDYRKSRKISGSKSDTADAELLADYLREHHKHLNVWQLSEGNLRQLKLLVEDRDKVVQQKVRLQNQLRSALLEYFPQAVKAFSDITTQTALAFLDQFPTFASTQGKTDNQFNKFLDENRCFHPKARQRFLDAMKLKPQKVDEAVVIAKSLFVATIVGQLRLLVASLAEYNDSISTLLNTFSDGDRFRSLPGVDYILGAKLLVAIGVDRKRFSKANELQSFWGTAPYTKSSGQYRSVHFRVACNKGMRTALEQMALASIRCSNWAKSYYQRKRQEGKRVHHALRCLANCWLKVIFAIWQNKENYDENIHLASIARHQLNQAVVTA